MRLLRVIGSVNPAAGGPINGLVNSSKRLIGKGHNIDTLTLDNPSSEWVSEFDLPLVTFNSFLGTYRYSPEFSKWLLSNVGRYDIVVIHGLWQFHSYATAAVCKKLSVPYVMFTHGMLDPWFNVGNPIKAFKKKLYWQLFERHTINNAACVLFTSEEEKSLAKKSFSPYSPTERVVAYGSPLPDVESELAKETFFSSFQILRNKKYVLFLSRIHKKKGIHLLIDALGQIQSLPDDFMLVIAGPDYNGLQAKLTKEIESQKLADRVMWLGMLKGEMKWGAYHAADVFILPSHQENFGIVVAEALSTETPVLITNKVNIWREIKAENAGFVENDDVNGVVRLLNRWLALDEIKKREMACRALACYKKHFSIDSAVDDLEIALCEVIDGVK